MKHAACDDCDVETLPADHGRAEYYMVHDEVWQAAGMDPNDNDDDGYLCIGCLEARLGRQLTRDDFTNAPINDLAYSDMRYAWSWRSKRLLQRLRASRWTQPQLDSA